VVENLVVMVEVYLNHHYQIEVEEVVKELAHLAEEENFLVKQLQFLVCLKIYISKKINIFLII